MRGIRLAAFFLAAALYAGCASHSVKTTRFEPATADPPNGVTYALPKCVLKTTIIYTRRGITEVTNGVHDQEVGEVVIKDPIRIEPVVVGDPANVFLLSASDLTDRAFLESGLSFTVADNGTLLGVVADIQDRTPQAGQALFSTGIAAARIAAALGENRDLSNRIDAVYRQIIAVASEDATNVEQIRNRVSRLKSLKEELDLLLQVAALRDESNQPIVRETQQTYVTVIDPADYVGEDGRIKPIEIDPGDLFGDGSTLPTVTITLHCADWQLANARAIHVPDGGRNGVIYRVPTAVPVSVDVDRTNVLTASVDFPQFGPVVVADVRSKGLTDSKTTVEFGGATGRLSRYEVSTGAPAAAVATALQQSAQELDAAIIDIRYSRRLEALEKQIAIMQAEKELHPSAPDRLSAAIDQLLGAIDRLQAARGTVSNLTSQDGENPAP